MERRLGGEMDPISHCVAAAPHTHGTLGEVIRSVAYFFRIAHRVFWMLVRCDVLPIQFAYFLWLLFTFHYLNHRQDLSNFANLSLNGQIVLNG